MISSYLWLREHLCNNAVNENGARLYSDSYRLQKIGFEGKPKPKCAENLKPRLLVQFRNTTALFAQKIARFLGPCGPSIVMRGHHLFPVTAENPLAGIIAEIPT